MDGRCNDGVPVVILIRLEIDRGEWKAIMKLVEADGEIRGISTFMLLASSHSSGGMHDW